MMRRSFSISRDTVMTAVLVAAWIAGSPVPAWVQTVDLRCPSAVGQLGLLEESLEPSEDSPGSVFLSCRYGLDQGDTRQLHLTAFWQESGDPNGPVPASSCGTYQGEEWIVPSSTHRAVVSWGFDNFPSGGTTQVNFTHPFPGWPAAYGEAPVGQVAEGLLPLVEGRALPCKGGVAVSPAPSPGEATTQESPAPAETSSSDDPTEDEILIAAGLIMTLLGAGTTVRLLRRKPRAPAGGTEPRRTPPAPGAPPPSPPVPPPVQAPPVPAQPPRSVTGTPVPGAVYPPVFRQNANDTCAIVSTQMIIQRLTGRDLSENALVGRSSSMPGGYQQNASRFGTGSQGIVDLLNTLGLDAEQRTMSLEEIRHAIIRGQQVTISHRVGGGNHRAVVEDIQVRDDGHAVLTIDDPWTGQRVMRSDVWWARAGNFNRTIVVSKPGAP